MRAAEFLVRAIVRLYPPAFRARYADDLLTAWHDQQAAGHGAARSIAGLVRAIVPIHLEARRRRRVHVLPVPGDSSMRYLLADARLTLRLARKQPGFALLTIATLALGIGANTAVFSVLNSVVLAPLPYQEPDRLVRIYATMANEPAQRQFLTAPDVVNLRDEEGLFSSVAVSYTYRELGGDLGAGDGPQRVRLMPVNADYFRTLTATPLMGRTFLPDEEVAGVRRIVLSHGLWASATGQDPDIVGKTLAISGESWEVIGVMRPTFHDVVTGAVAAWIPQNLQLAGSNHWNNHFLTAVGRLAPGVTVAQAQARVNAMMQRLADEIGRTGQPRTTRLDPLHEDVVGESTSTVYILMGAAGLVLLIACLNVANLFIARSLAQSRETAIRTALGAVRRRLVGQRLTESVLLAAVGGLVGSLVAYWGVKGLLAISPASLARAEEIGLDGTLLGFGLLVTLVTGLLFGAWPAYRAARVDPTEALHDGARGNTGGRGGRRARSVLVSAQVAVALMLLVGAGVLVRAFMARQAVNLGFDSSGVATFEVHLPPVRYGDPAQRVQFHDAFQDRLRAVPGVEQVGVTSWLPANGHYHQWGINLPGNDPDFIPMMVRVIDGDFLDVMRIPLTAGRRFEATDRLDSPPVAIISRSVAQRAYGSPDAVGRTFRLGREFTVVGVVDDVAYEAQGTRFDMLYLSHDQYAADRNWALTYTIRTASAPDAVYEPARRVLAAIDPALVLYRPRSMNDVLSGHHARAQFTLMLMGIFAAVALTLAAVGVYGVLAHAVTQRTHEIGVRMALGAHPRQVRAIVMGQGMALAAAGIGLGLVGAFALSGFLGSMTPGVNARDPVVFGTVSVVLAVVILAAGYVPARRATRVDPLQSLRGD